MTGNVVVLVLDDVGVESLASYGAPAPVAWTPTLDALAAEGVRFEVAWAMPSCSPARAALLTGRYGRRSGVGDWFALEGETWSLPLSERTLPELLPDGVATALAGKWHLGARDAPGAADQPRAQGFHHHAGTFGNIGSALTLSPGRGWYRWERLEDGVAGESRAYATTQVVDDAVAFVTTLPAPWVVVVAPNAPHGPLHAPPPGLVRPGVPTGTDPERFRAMLEALDAELARLVAAAGPDATWLVVGDNGNVGAAIGDDRPRKHTIAERGLRVPLFVAGPGIAPGVSRALASVVDVTPTVLALTGADVPPGLDGVSLLPALRDPEAPGPREVLYAERFLPNGPQGVTLPWIDEVAVRDATWKLVRAVGPEGPALGLHRPAGLDDGPDLLAAPLSPEAEAALARLLPALVLPR